MKTTKYVLATALGVIALFVVQPAHADTLTTYTINFTTASGSPPPVSGSFTYDSTNPLFTNFLVNWNGEVYDLTASANSPLSSYPGCTGASTPSFGFTIISQSLTGCSSPSEASYFWQGAVYAPATPPDSFVMQYEGAPGFNAIFAQGTQAGTGSGILAFGGWSITPTATFTTPEPSSLLLLGTGLVGLMGIGLYKRRLANAVIEHA